MHAGRQLGDGYGFSLCRRGGSGRRGVGEHFKGQSFFGKDIIEPSRDQRVSAGGQRLVQVERTVAHAVVGETIQPRAWQRRGVGIEDLELHGQRGASGQAVARHGQRAIVDRLAGPVSAAVEPEPGEVTCRTDGQRQRYTGRIVAAASGDRQLGRPVRPRGKIHVGRHGHGQPALVIGGHHVVYQPPAVGRGKRPFHGGRPGFTRNRGGDEIVNAGHARLQLARSADHQPQVPDSDGVQLPAVVKIAAQRGCD